MVILRVSYRVRVHQVADFEKIFSERVVPLIPRHGLRLLGIWRTFVGNVGEYLELWEFDSISEFGSRWKSLMSDPELRDVFKQTGSMVEDESFALLEPAEIRPKRGPKSHLI